MQSVAQVAIVGVGLLGGSLGLALRQRKLAAEVIGIGHNPASLATALAVGAVDRVTLDLAEGVAHADLIVVCTPVALIADQIRAAAAACPPGAVITDVGSTKAALAVELGADLGREVRFVGSHPLAGSEKSGPAAASATLFVGRKVIVTPTSGNSRRELDLVQSFWASVGADVLEMTPDEHDRALAATSHVPHVVAAALAGTVPISDLILAASGFRDTTRIAAGGPELWRQILLDNATNVVQGLDRFANQLAAFRAAVATADAPRLLELLTHAKRTRDALGS